MLFCDLILIKYAHTYYEVRQSNDSFEFTWNAVGNSRINID